LLPTAAAAAAAAAAFGVIVLASIATLEIKLVRLQLSSDAGSVAIICSIDAVSLVNRT